MESSHLQFDDGYLADLLRVHDQLNDDKLMRRLVRSNSRPCIFNLLLRLLRRSRPTRPNDTWMFQLCYTTSWTPTRPWMTPTPTSKPPPPSCMENVKRRPKTMTTSAESEVLQQANLAEVINRKLFEAPETRRPHRPSRICPAAGYGAHIHIREPVFVFSKI